jgi:HAD superfamily hydrolase (TIGR01509 family)
VSDIDLVIFDCDGVLVDSEAIAARVGAAVLTDLGWPVTPEELVDRFAGCTDDDFRSGVEAELGRPLAAGWDEPYASWYDAAFDAELRAVPGVATAIAALELPYCVASNGSHHKVVANLRRVGLAEAFDDDRRFSAQDVDQGKPAPDLFLHAARTLGVAPQRCVVVEDSPTGLAAARAAGMRRLAYAGGVIAVDRLAGLATTVFDDMADLPGLLRALEDPRRLTVDGSGRRR